jgi:peptidyl-prolyl cis-trans isomerase B (cyclophilin B)
MPKQVIMETSVGDITLELYPEKAPITVENFLSYADKGFYDGLIFHRVIQNFMIQGGGFESGMNQKESGEGIKNEANNGLANARGSIAMARTVIVDSATSQFFINLTDNDFLNYRGDSPSEYGYAVFGKVIEGMDIVEKIAQASTHTVGPFENVPEEDIVINSVKDVK